jgi:tocopherol O-methyltransferase
MMTTIARYYDSNTARFLRFGRSGEAAAIHRAIWGPGMQTRAEAFLYLNRLVAEQILVNNPSGHLLDLGCGVGGTATWLAQMHGAHVTGVTLSPVQARMAGERATCLGLQDFCRYIQADFHHLPADLEMFDGAYAIEAYAHASEPERFFAEAAEHLKAGGRLFIADDFLAPKATLENPWVGRVRRDWHLANLRPASEAATLAEAAGFRLVSDQNLSPYIRHWPQPWLEVVRLFIRLPIHTPAWENLSGGVALQHCYRRGWTEYHALVLEKG